MMISSSDRVMGGENAGATPGDLYLPFGNSSESGKNLSKLGAAAFTPVEHQGLPSGPYQFGPHPESLRDIDGFVDCGGLPPEKLQRIRSLPGWNTQRLYVCTPHPKAAPGPAGDWLVGNYYGGLSKETGKTRDIDLVLVGRTDGEFDPAGAGMGEHSACFSRDQVLRTNFLVEFFQHRFEAKGYRIEFAPVRVVTDGPVHRPAELEWNLS